MTVFLSMSMSLDGFVAAENRSPRHPLGEGGMRLHNWLFHEQTSADEEIARQLFATTGAVIVGWRTYIDAIHDGWGGANPYGVPVFVLCRTEPPAADAADGFTFVTDGMAVALDRARHAAQDRHIWVQGGADVARQFLRAGLLDELHIHLAPVLMGRGLHLFDLAGADRVELEALGATQTPGATHLKFKVRR